MSTHEYTSVHTMTSEQFCYWLQGYFEMYNPTIIPEQATTIIKDHLSLVFKKETPDRGVKMILMEDAKEKIDPVHLCLTC